MAEENKKSGLQKDISSIFAGLEDIDNGRTDKPPVTPEEVSPPSGLVPPPSGSVPPPSGPVPPLPTQDKKYLARSPLSSSTPMRESKDLISGGSFPNHRNAFVGLDIGSSSIKLIQLCPVSEGWEIGGYAIQEFQMSGDGNDIVDNEHFARRLKEIFAAVGVRGAVVCSLRGDEVSTGLIQLARLPKAELASASRLEAGRRVTFNIDKALIQNIAVEKDPARPGGKLNYIVTVVSRELISTILGALRQSALQAASLLPVPFAWKDFLRALGGADTSPVAVVDIGARRTQVCIYKGNRLHFSREFETGGRDVTEAVIQAGQTFGIKTKLSWEEAEEIKKSTNFLQADSMQILKENLSASQVAGMVRPVLEKIAQESKRSLEYFRQLYRQEEVSRVYLCGGGALSPGFERFFRERLRPPVEAFGINDRIKLHSSIKDNEEIEVFFPRLARAAALSMSRRWEVNFIPTMDKVLQNILRRKMLILIPIIALFLVSFMFYRSKVALIPRQENIVEAKKKQLAGFQGDLAPYQVRSGLMRQLAAREKVGLYSSLRQPNWKGILKEFSRITPPFIILSRINSLEGEDPHRILCSGQVLERETSLGSGITQFVVKVENSPFFKDVEKIYEDIDRGTFSFSCTLIY